MMMMMMMVRYISLHHRFQMPSTDFWMGMRGKIRDNETGNTQQKLRLVGGWFTPLKNMKVNWDDWKPNIWENKIDVPNHQLDAVFS